MERLMYLRQRFFDNTATPAEREELYQLLKNIDPETSEFFNPLEDELKKDVQPTAVEQLKLNTILSKLEQKIRQDKGKVVEFTEEKNFRTTRVLRIAASLLILMAAAYGIYTFTSQLETQQEVAVDFTPGTDKATLTLANGSTISLNGTGSAIPSQGNAQVQNDAGSIAYMQDKALMKSGETVYNTITTKRGGQYKLTLADGSTVELNAASSIKFPTSFTETERVVEITGEAYFEIASLLGADGKKVPFRVRLESGAEIEVLGTHFNVMAYAEEDAIKTTLLEGSVRVSLSGVEGTVLKPNQQAKISKDGSIKVENVNISEAVAWKDDMFIFRETELKEIMRQVSRWYDVDVKYENDVKGLRFDGKLSRKENASSLLNILEMTGSVDFEIDGRQIIVKKKK